MAVYNRTPFPDFKTFMERAVLPREAELSGERRLDGEPSGGNFDIFGSFAHQGVLWVVHADTHFATLRIAYDEVLRDGGSDPFIAEPTATGMSLNLSPDLRAKYPQRFKHIYIYDVPSTRGGGPQLKRKARALDA